MGNREFRGNARTFYILTVNLRLVCGFSVNSRAIDRYFTGFTTFNRKFAAGKCPVFSNHGAFPGSKFSG